MRPRRFKTPATSTAASAAQNEFDKALQRMGGNVALYRSMAESFGPTAEALHEQLQEHIRNGEKIDIGRVLHTLKGIARTMGAAELGDYAEREEKRIKESGTLQSPESTPQALLTLIRRSCDEARQFAAGLTPAEKRKEGSPGHLVLQRLFGYTRR